MKEHKEKPVKRKITVSSIIFSIISIAYVMPIVIVIMNSFKKKIYISSEHAFKLPDEVSFNGIENYIYGINKVKFFDNLYYSVIITVTSVLLILICCSMCAWYMSRSNSLISKIIYYLFVFSMIVPFQLVMYTLSKTSDTLGLNTPYNLCIIYLGFGAGLAVFMFSGFVKGIPIEIEEAAMIDGCNPIQTYFRIVLPILKPTYISVGILETMWIWNDYLLPWLTLDIKQYKTVPIVIQYLKSGYGKVEMGAIMACIVLAITPIIILYLVCQKHIIEGVVAGAVKG